MPGIFICVCGDTEGVACGVCIPGMFICICCGEGCDSTDCLGDDNCAGMFIPGLFSSCFWLTEFFCAGAFFLVDAPFRRCIPDISIPGLFIPDIFPISCFLAIRLFLVATLFFLTLVFRLALAFDFGIFIPGMFCMSCPRATTLGPDASIRTVTMIAHNPAIRMKAPTFNLFMIPPLNTSSLQKQMLHNAHTEAHVRTTELAKDTEGN
jgi:hypothetical protein